MEEDVEFRMISHPIGRYNIKEIKCQKCKEWIDESKILKQDNKFFCIKCFKKEKVV